MAKRYQVREPSKDHTFGLIFDHILRDTENGGEIVAATVGDRADIDVLAAVRNAGDELDKIVQSIKTFRKS